MKLKRRNSSDIVTIDLATPVAVGGEATIYRILGAPSLVAKIYHDPIDTRIRKLVAMIANPPSDPTANQNHITIAWPVDVLYSVDMRDFKGFVMPRVSGMRPLIDVYNPLARRQSMPLFNYRYLMRTARNLAGAVNALHMRSYVVGDLSESNILVADTAMVTLVDTDSFQVREADGKLVHRCVVGRPDFTPPEIQGASFADIDRLPEHDCFALAVLIFQLLMEGTHPFAGEYEGADAAMPYEGRIKGGQFAYGSLPVKPKPLAPSSKILAPELRALFTRCFEDGHLQRRARPSASTWLAALEIAGEHLVGCRVNPQHVYGDHLDACPWCERKAMLAGRDPFPDVGQIPAKPAMTQSPLPPASALPSTAPSSQTVAPAPAKAPPPPVAAPPAKTADRLVAPTIVPSSPRRVPVAFIGAIVAVVLACGGFVVARNSAAAHHNAEVRLLLADAQTEFSSVDVVASSPDASSKSLHSVIGHCDDLVNSKAVGLADIVSAAKALKGRSVASLKALNARVQLDDVVDSIERNRTRQLTPSEAQALRERLLSDIHVAVADSGKALDLDSQCAAAWVERIRAYRLAANPNAANEATAKALVLFPDDKHIRALANQ